MGFISEPHLNCFLLSDTFRDCFGSAEAFHEKLNQKMRCPKLVLLNPFSQNFRTPIKALGITGHFKFHEIV